ncbi:MAG TPA: 50S ribosomal protein L22 [archaeon]|nr:50S ribosomal protein L22 [archaeon]
MIAKAKARFVRMSSRKIKLVIDLIRGKSLEEAFTILRFTRKAAVEPVRKLVQSAYSNAVSQLGSFDLNTQEIIVKSIRVDQGPSFKRWMPRAMGRATPILKRTSHITVELDVPEPEKEE